MFDIETTGLYPARDRIMLSGILNWEENGSALATQYFDQDGQSEEEVIRATIKLLASSKLIITYNGRSFDLPFLKKRAEKYGLVFGRDYDLPPDLDLYLVAKGYSDIKTLTGSLSQKSLESFMGISHLRKDRIHGGISIKLYSRYLSADEETKAPLLHQILLHNLDDIAQLSSLLPVVEKTDFPAAMYHMGFPVYVDQWENCSGEQNQSDGYNIRDIKVSAQGLTVKADLLPGARDSLLDQVTFPTEEHPCHLVLSGRDKTLELFFPSESVSKAVEVLDARSLLGESGSSAIEKYPGVSSGYLILRQGGKIQHLEICMFIIEYLKGLSARLGNS